MQRRRVALILSEINSFRLIPGIHRVAAQGRDYWLIDIFRPISEIKKLLQQWKPEGLIVEWMPFVTELLLALDIPTVVTVGEPGGLKVPAVDVDDERVGAMAASHLLGLSLQHFAFLGEETDYSHQRERSFRSKVEAASYSCDSFFLRQRTARKYIEHWHESGKDLMEWLRSLPKPVGVFAAHDPSGRLLAETCRAQGFRIPEEVAIIGANNDYHVCGLTYPPLSSIEIPWDTIGYETAQLMERYLNRSETVSPETLLVKPTRVVARRSSDFLSLSNPVLASALEFIHEHACSGIRVVDVVQHLRVARRTLERDFKSVLGRTLHEEIIRTRLDHSKELLTRKDLSVDQIADYCGFGRNERFTVNFKRWEGMTPRAYRKTIHRQDF